MLRFFYLPVDFVVSIEEHRTLFSVLNLFISNFRTFELRRFKKILMDRAHERLLSGARTDVKRHFASLTTRRIPQRHTAFSFIIIHHHA